MTKFKKLQTLPFIEVTFKMYETSLPYEEENGTRKYFATFREEGAELTDGDDNVLARTN